MGLFKIKRRYFEANIVEGFVNNSQAKRWHVNAIELFERAYESGEVYL